MAGLFNTQGDVAAFEAQQRAQSPQQTLRGSLFNLGNAGGDALQRGAFGTDTRSPAEMKALQVQQIARRVDWKDPNSIRDGMNLMNQAGFQQEAFALEKLLSTKTAVATPVSSEMVRVEDPSNPGNFAMQREDTYSDGTKKFVGPTVTEQAATGGSAFQGTVKLPASMNKETSVNDQFERALTGRIIESGFLSDVDMAVDANVEGVKGIVGDINRLANERRNKIADKLLAPFEARRKLYNDRGQVMPDDEKKFWAQEFANEESKGSIYYANEIMNEMETEGTLENYVNERFGFKDLVDLSVKDGVQPTESSLGASAADTRRFNAESAAVRKKASEFNRQGVPDGVFEVRDLSNDALVQAFASGSIPKDDAMFEKLDQLGYSTPQTDNELGFHKSRWEMARNYPKAVAEYVTLLEGSKSRATNYMGALIDQARDDNNGTRAAELTLIVDYFKNWRSVDQVQQQGRVRGRQGQTN
jgi:hypothetical protein